MDADPYGCGGLWERYLMGWEQREDDGGGAVAGAGAGERAAALVHAMLGAVVGRALRMPSTSRPPAAQATLCALPLCTAGGASTSAAAGGASGGAVQESARMNPWELYPPGLSSEAALAELGPLGEEQVCAPCTLL